jgi:hypothetical protein
MSKVIKNSGKYFAIMAGGAQTEITIPNRHNINIDNIGRIYYTKAKKYSRNDTIAIHMLNGPTAKVKISGCKIIYESGKKVELPDFLIDIHELSININGYMIGINNPAYSDNDHYGGISDSDSDSYSKGYNMFSFNNDECRGTDTIYINPFTERCCTYWTSKPEVSPIFIKKTFSWISRAVDCRIEFSI